MGKQLYTKSRRRAGEREARIDVVRPPRGERDGDACASNAAKFIALYGQTRRRFMVSPPEPRAPSAANTLESRTHREHRPVRLVLQLDPLHGREQAGPHARHARDEAKRGLPGLSMRVPRRFPIARGRRTRERRHDARVARDTLMVGNDLRDPERPTPRAVASDREAVLVSPV